MPVRESKESYNAWMREWRRKNATRLKEERKQRYWDNIENEKAKNKTNYSKHAEKRRMYASQYRKDHPEWCRHSSNKRRALKLQAIPKWANLDAIELIYRNCPNGYEVDHIIPLKNDLVCGLHVETNLQYLTREDNRRKKNSFLGD